MKNSKGFVYFLIFSLIAGLVSCDTGSNDNNNIALFVVASQKIQEAQKASALKKSMVKMSGKISMPEGAVPSEFIEAANAAGKNSTRGTGIDVSNLTGYTYFIETKNSAGETFNPDYDFDNTDGTFTITLLPGTWKLKAGINNDEGTTVYISDEITQTVTAEDSVFNKTFVLHPLQKSDGEGHFKINMTVSEKVKKVVMKFVSGDSGKWGAAGLDTEVPLTVSGTTVRLPGTTVTMASGSYTVRFLFYDSTATHPTLLFSSYQTINIYDGLTSDKWNASASIGDADSVIDSSGNFVVTNSLVNSYMISNIYVASAANGGNDNNAGSYYGPVATLNKAFRSIASYGNASGEYTINIKGELSGNFEVPDSINSKAQKITICGADEAVNGVPVDTLNGNRQGTVLTISSNVPVVIQNLKITGGYVNGDGAGIRMTDGTNVTLEDGALVGEISDEPADSDNSKNGNRSEGCGAGIYNYGGTLTLERGSRVSYNYAGEGDDDLWGSKQGGGIYCSKGTINIKEGASVSYNGADSRGGGIFLENVEGSVKTKLIMDGGEISNNKVLLFGGGVFMGGDGATATGNVEFKMSGGKISKNESTSLREDMGQGGAAIWMDGGAFEMSGNSEISENVSYKLAGGIKINEKYCKVELKGGTIKNNIATSEFITNPNTNPPTTTHSGDGGAIHNGGTLIISGPVSIPTGGEVPSKYMNDSHPDHAYWEKVRLLCKNDVYMALKGDTYYPIQVTSAFSTTGNEKIPVSLGGWKRKKTFLKGVDGSGISDVTTYSNHFEFTKSGMNISVPETDKSQARMTAPYYVAPDGAHEDETAGTESDPFDTIATAISRFTDGDKETVYVKGTVSAATVIGTDFITTKCSSLTIEGASNLDSDGNPQDVLTIPNGENTTVLQIDTQVPITLKKIKITGGDNDSGNGGGIAVNAGSVTLGNGAVVAGNNAIYGGGISVASGASLFMYGTAIVGDNGTDSNYSNLGYECGGGIYSEGNLYLGYTGMNGATPVVATGENSFTGGVCHNKTFPTSTMGSTYGGGIYSKGNLYVAGGKISYNNCGHRGQGTFGGYGAGINIQSNSNAELTGNLEIANNYADKQGGGIYIESNGIVKLKEDTAGNAPLIKENTSMTGHALYSAGVVEISGKVYIPYDSESSAKNDVYLHADKYITIAGNLSLPSTAPSGAKNVTITPAAWTRGKQVLTASGTNAATLIANNASRFATIDEDFLVEQSTKTGEGSKGIICSPIILKETSISESQQIGTRSKPFSTIKKALSVVDADNSVITVVGTVSGKQTFDVCPSSVTTVTIIGEGTSPKLNAGGEGSVLTVNQEGKEVILKNLTITGGETLAYGGGINITAGTVKLGDGVIITGNKASTSGGGVYLAGSSSKLFMYGSSLIGDSVTSTTIATSGVNANSNTYSNSASSGAGIYNNGGSVYIGYDGLNGATPTIKAMTAGYGVRRNYASEKGGGIYQAGGTLMIASGNISYNNGNNNAGAIYCDANATLSGGSIEGNTSTSGGGFYIATAKKLTIDGTALIAKNTAGSGGAVYNDGILEISAGTIGASGALNTATNDTGAGGAIYQNGSFIISGSAVIYAGTGVGEKQNDVYLADTKTITVDFLSSTSGTIAKITPSAWKRGTNILSSASVLSDAEKGCFVLTNDNTGWERKDKSGTGADTKKYVYITSPIYVASSTTGDTTRKVCSVGVTSGATGTKTKPYATIAAALSNTDLAYVSNVITIDGTLSAQSIASTVTLPTGVTAVTLQGYKAEGATTSLAKIDGGGSSCALSIAKSTTYTIKDLQITKGKTAYGGGIYLGSGTVNLDSGAKVYSNQATTSGAGIYVANGAVLNIKSGSEIYSNSAYSGNINGGGICNLGTVDMTGGSVYSNSANNGGGIYSSGTLYVRGSALIGNSTETPATGSTAGTYCSNSASASGGGIYNSGTLYFGCDTTGAKNTTTGYALDSGCGVRRNYANDGGGIYNTGTFKSGSGSISYNYAPNNAGGLYAGGSTNNMGGLGVSYNKTGKNGAGVYVASSKSAEVTAQSGVNHNTASSGSSDVCGGGIYVAGTLTTTEALNANWNSASITGGSGKAYGGCVYIASGGKFVYSKGQLGGTSQSNTVSNTVSGSTDKAYGGSVYQGGTFEVSANGYIPKGSLRSDDVYLPSEKYITVTDVISGNSESSQMTITPATWKRGTQVLAKGGDLSYTNFKNQIVKFKGSETDWLAVYNSYVGKLYTSYKIYVSQSGYDDDKNGLGTSAKPYKTISKAVGECWTTSYDFTVYVSGTIKGAHTIGGTDVTINAKSLTLEGTGTSPTIDAEKTSGIRPLTINTSLGVTIKNLTITNGNVTPNYGGGIYIEGGCALTLDDGASVLSNKASSGGGGVYVDAGSTLIMKSGSTINKNVSTGGGGGVYNKGKVLMSGTARIGANGTSKPGTSSTSPTGNYTGLQGGGIYNAGTVCLGYTAWTNETTNTPKKLEGGVTQNYASNVSGGIYVYTAAKVYMKTGNISYNRANNGGGMTNATGTVKLLGGKMESNWADSNKSGAIWQNGDLYLGGDVYIPYGGSLGLNDLYLNDKSVLLNTDIAPPEDCTTGVIATIYPNTYASIGVVGQNYAYAPCLAVVPEPGTTPPQAWTINTTNGYLKKTTAITSSNISSVVSGLSSGAELKADSTFGNDALETLKTSLGSTSNTIKLDLSQSSVTSLSDATKIPSCLESIVLPNNFAAYGLLWQGLRNNSKLKTIEVSPQNKKLASDSGILYGLDDNGKKVRLVLYPASKTGSSYTLPSGVITLGGGCFWGNKNLTGITNLTQITQIDNFGNQFRLCEKITSINLTNVTTTGDYGYGFIKGCSALTTVTLASTLTTLEGNCFSECPSLTTIHFKSTTPPTINSSDPKLFSDCNASLKIYVPSSARSAWLNATGTNGFANSACNALAGSLSSKVYGE